MQSSALLALVIVSIAEFASVRGGTINDVVASPDVRSVTLRWQCAGACGRGFLVMYRPADEDSTGSLATDPSMMTRRNESRIDRLMPNTNYVIEIYSLDQMRSTDADGSRGLVTVRTQPVTLTQLECMTKAIKATIHTGKGFGGVIYAQNHYKNCIVIGRQIEHEYVMEMALDQCAEQETNEIFTTTIVVQENNKITTIHDSAMAVSCDYSPPNREKTVTAKIELEPSENGDGIVFPVPNKKIRDRLSNSILNAERRAVRKASFSPNSNRLFAFKSSSSTGLKELNSAKLYDTVVVAICSSAAIVIVLVLFFVHRYHRTQNRFKRKLAALQSLPSASARDQRAFVIGGGLATARVTETDA